MYIIGCGGENSYDVIGYTNDEKQFHKFLDECKKCVKAIQKSQKKQVNPFKSEINDCKNEISKRERTIGELGILIKHKIDIELNKQKCSELKKEIRDLNTKIQNYNITTADMNKPDLSMFSESVQEFSDLYEGAFEYDEIWIQEIKEFEF